MMNCLRRKLASRRGASITFALLLFLVCTVIGVIVLVAATAAAGRMSRLAESDARYYAVNSAAQLLREEIENGRVVVTRQSNIPYTQTDYEFSNSNYVTEITSSTDWKPDPTNPYTGKTELITGFDFQKKAAQYCVFGGTVSDGSISADQWSKAADSAISFGTDSSSNPITKKTLETMYLSLSSTGEGALTDAAEVKVVVELDRSGWLLVTLCDAEKEECSVTLLFRPNPNPSQFPAQRPTGKGTKPEGEDPQEAPTVTNSFIHEYKINTIAWIYAGMQNK